MSSEYDLSYLHPGVETIERLNDELTYRRGELDLLAGLLGVGLVLPVVQFPPEYLQRLQHEYDIHVGEIGALRIQLIDVATQVAGDLAGGIVSDPLQEYQLIEQMLSLCLGTEPKSLL